MILGDNFLEKINSLEWDFYKGASCNLGEGLDEGFQDSLMDLLYRSLNRSFIDSLWMSFKDNLKEEFER